MSSFKSGFVALVGLPNVGKSTLINKIVGAKVAIVSKKPQTTRNRISGIYNDAGSQIIFLDTPGIHKAKNKLDRYMSFVIDQSMIDVDCIVMLTDIRKGLREEEKTVLEKIQKSGCPYILAVNKTDAVDPSLLETLLEPFNAVNSSVNCISALSGEGVTELLSEIKKSLKEGPKYYPDSEYTDQSLAQLCAETIREKALKHLGKEIPHGVGVEITKIQRDDARDIVDMEAVIYCEKNSHKGIIIGKQGARLKKIGSEARSDIEDLIGSKVFLELWVKVRDDWRNDASFIKTLGYRED